VSSELVARVWLIKSLSIPEREGKVNNRPITPAEKCFLLRLAENGDPWGRGIWPSLKELCEETGHSPRSAQRSLRAMIDAGLIKQTAGARGHNPPRYEFVVSALPEIPGRPEKNVIGFDTPLRASDNDLKISARDAKLAPLPTTKDGSQHSSQSREDDEIVAQSEGCQVGAPNPARGAKLAPLRPEGCQVGAPNPGQGCQFGTPSPPPGPSSPPHPPIIPNPHPIAEEVSMRGNGLSVDPEFGRAHSTARAREKSASRYSHAEIFEYCEHLQKGGSIERPGALARSLRDGSADEEIRKFQVERILAEQSARLKPRSAKHVDRPDFRKCDETTTLAVPLFLDAVKKRLMNQHAFRTWFSPIKRAFLQGTVLWLEVPNSTFSQWMESTYSEIVQSAFTELRHNPGYSFDNLKTLKFFWE
jgi:hypothetical protein